MDPMAFDTEGATRIDVRGQALVNRAFLRVMYTGTREQIAVMSLPPYAEIGNDVHPHTDQLLVVVEGNGEARVGDDDLSIEGGDLVFVEAGTHHNIINRATLPMQLIAVFSPPAYAPGTVLQTMGVREPGVPERWRAFPWVPESSGANS